MTPPDEPLDDDDVLNKPEVSLVVVAFHRSEHLDALLGATADRRIELVVVNIEQDPDVHMICTRHFAIEVMVPNNPGYGAAVNRGVAAAHAPVVLFSNDDLEYDSAAVRCLAAAVRHGGADVAVPRVIGSAGTPVRSVQAVPSLRSLVLEWALLPDTPVSWLARRISVEKWRAPNVPERIHAASGLAVAVRHDLIVECPLPEVYFLYWEESEWFALLGRRGAHVEFRPEVSVVHLGGRAVASPEKSALLARNAVRCIRRLYGRRAARAAYAVTIAWQLRLVLTGLARVTTKPSRPTRSLLTARVAGLRSALASWNETL